MPGKHMAFKVINKTNKKLKFLYKKNEFLIPELYTMLCNAQIQAHFDYKRPAWYPNLTEKKENTNYAK